MAVSKLHVFKVSGNWRGILIAAPKPASRREQYMVAFYLLFGTIVIPLHVAGHGFGKTFTA